MRRTTSGGQIASGLLIAQAVFVIWHFSCVEASFSKDAANVLSSGALAASQRSPPVWVHAWHSTAPIGMCDLSRKLLVRSLKDNEPGLAIHNASFDAILHELLVWSEKGKRIQAFLFLLSFLAPPHGPHCSVKVNPAALYVFA